MTVHGSTATLITSGTARRYLESWLYPFDPTIAQVRRVTRFDDLVSAIEGVGARSLCIYRTYALGDILMCMPIARALHRMFGFTSPVKIVVGHHFLARLSDINKADRTVSVVSNRGYASYGCDLHVDLNFATCASHVHITDLYARALGIELEIES